MKKNKLKIIAIFVTIIVSLYYFLNFTINREEYRNLKSILSKEQKAFIKKYFFPHKNNLRNHRTTQDNFNKNYLFSELELKVKNSGKDIKTTKSNIRLSNLEILEKYNLNPGFYAGIHEISPGSGYIDFFENKLFILSSRGILAFKKNLFDDTENFKQINNNIDEFIGLKQFKKNKWFSLKDLMIYENKIFISYTEEIKKNCWNTSVIYGKINLTNIRFKKLFSPKECIHSKKNIDMEFNAHQSGGRIISFDESSILLTIGDYRNRYLAQKKDSINGKIIKINLNNSKYNIISMGHRNPQGLYFDKEKNFLLETEHGPKGGDEINLIQINQTNSNEVLNFGWAIASAGEHYRKNETTYQKYPLFKSHEKYGFIEPLKSFVPSIGISEIVKVKKEQYVASSLKDRSIYFFELDNQKIINFQRVEVFERVRDLKFYNDKLYLFLEDTSSIGVLNLK